jgi:diguanylate cyclase (GGDEF)-like protein
VVLGRTVLQIFPPGPRPLYCLAAAGATRSGAIAVPASWDYCALGHGLLASRITGQSVYAPLTIGSDIMLGVENPVYRGGVLPATVAARKAAFLGWLGELIVPKVIVEAAAVGHPGTGIVLHYRAGSYAVSFSHGRTPRGARVTTFAIGGGWSVSTRSEGWSSAVFGNANASLIFLGGALLILLLATLVFVLGTSRTRAIALVEEKTRELSHQAQHDSLTGLANRSLVLARAQQMLAHARRDPHVEAGALFVDVDNFKPVNDIHGHAAGDSLLKAIAERLNQVVRAQDTVGRIGGDEFVVLAEARDDNDDLIAIVQRLMETLGHPIPIADGTARQVTVSVGVATGRYMSAEDLLRDADEALYEAKGQGKDQYAVHAASTA